MWGFHDPHTFFLSKFYNKGAKQMYTQTESKSVPISEDIFPMEAWSLISQYKEKDKLIIIDVSTPKEYKDLHIEGAINISILSWFFKARLDALDRDKMYLVYCKVGARSKAAKKLMELLGFNRVYNIVGGTLLWEEEGLPFATGTSGTNKLSLCPFFFFVLIKKRVKQIWTEAFRRSVKAENQQT
jgi:rhodanese-related sulfurtransferase